MLTNNFRAIAAALPTFSGGTTIGSYPITSPSGRTYYFIPEPGSNYYPNTLFQNGAVSSSPSNGILVGSGTTPPTPDDYSLEKQIGSGITLTVASKTQTVDGCGNPALSIILSVTNTSGSEITIAEVGWFVTVYHCSTLPNSTYGSNSVMLMLDRTVLETPITLQNGKSALIDYSLKSDLIKTHIVSGVEIVPFSYGTDAQIAAMIIAARNGLIDLQADAKWHLGDIRKISVGAVDSYAAHDGYLFITSFDEYESCGNVLQLDMCYNYLKAPMNSTNTNAGGYGATSMYSTFLPAVEAALPQWLRELLLTFNVCASAGSKSSESVIIQNNKLALRSVKEIFDGKGSGYDEESSQISAFKRDSLQKVAVTGSNSSRWMRSPATNNTDFCTDTNTTGSSGHASATTNFYIAPFMCV